MLDYLLDETPIVAQHDAIIAANVDLRDHLSMINAALDCLSRLPEALRERDSDELTMLRLSIRCFNSGAAALRLLRCGYFQPCLTMVRDLIEVYFLMDLFNRDRDSLTRWHSSPEKVRKRDFKPVKVRERLDALDGYKDQRRAKAYALLSTYGAHPSPDGFSLISPDNLTQIGPFPDQTRLRALLEELAQHLAYAADVVVTFAQEDSGAVAAVAVRYRQALNHWRKRYLPTEQSHWPGN
ncbi:MULTISPECIES: hypothetical protein [unclassified Rhizobium]|uniref:hypothetical protein n=1 Tax=unclassified Rhizobium TaxID=2613769 RepID=UPI001AD97957|nr:MULTISPECIES: hypothetical protein [unclassified Rhizobium]MBO9102428.1 hypothetical protein [Rhizobium sp. L58/93]MBO9169956.1 hypothetical protein [Rhizobium sp. L245/93]MBO9188232.1 hypothetical protein [Rhizobium sp. E27B/91]QXZ82833.1 hypothetical protein J5287_12170 [Rhizobium sp. K1/93]QXZ89654.1 hypothetical protein J5280_16420 [Rhizobium sp. K15/93]